MNDVFLIKTRVRRALNDYVKIIKDNNWPDAYKDVSGDESFADGIACGYNNGYVDGCHELKQHLRFVIKKNPGMTADELLKNIIYEEDETNT